MPRHLARGVSAPLRVTAERALGRVRLRQPAPAALIVEPREGDGTLNATVVRAPPRPPRARRGCAAQRGSARPRPLASRGGGRAEVTVYPDVPSARRLAPRRPPGTLPVRRPAHARPARARHRVRVDPRLRAGRRHPPGQLARHRAHAASDEQPVPGRAGPRGDAADRRRPADGRAARGPHTARRRGRRRGGGGAGGRRARRPLRHAGVRPRGAPPAGAAARRRPRGRARAAGPSAARRGARLRARVPERRGQQALARVHLLRPARGDRRAAARGCRAGARPAARRHGRLVRDPDLDEVLATRRPARTTSARRRWRSTCWPRARE